MNNPEYAAALAPLVSRVRTDVCWVKRPGEHPSSLKSPLTAERLSKHCNGGPAYGAALMQPGQSVTLMALLDLDSHKGATPWRDMCVTAERVIAELQVRGLRAVPFRSSGGKGIHLYLVWDVPQDAYSVRQLLRTTLEACGLVSGTRGVVHGEVEIFPKQDSVPEGKLGNMFILPLAGESVPLEPLCDLEPLPKSAALSLDWPVSRPVPPLERPARELSVVEPSVELAAFREALAAIPNAGEHELDYDAWRNVIFSIHHATGGSDEGLALAHEFSARAGKADLDFLDNRVWPYIDAGREGGITDRYVMHLAGSYGWQEDITGEFEVLPEESTDKPSRFAVQPVSEFVKAKPLSWLIKGVLPQAALIVMYGESGSGKSFMAWDMGVAIAQGQDWRGIKTKPGRVVGIVAEGVSGARNRFKAYCYQNNIPIDSLNIGVIDAAPNFLVKADAVDVAKAIKAGGGADLIIVDTFAQVIPGGDENSGKDLGIALQHCKSLNRECGCPVMLIHHSGKDASKGARGHSSLRAAADAELEVIRADDARAMTITKMKDGEDGQEFGFRLQVVQTGEVDEDLEPITSCVVEHTDGGAAPARPAKKRRGQGANERALVDTFHDMMELGNPDTGIPKFELRNKAIAIRFGDSATHSQKTNMDRSLRTLISENVLREAGGMLFHGEDSDE